MAFSRKGMATGEEGKCVWLMGREPTVTFGCVEKSGFLEQY
jgi:hypothetical protein